MREYELEILGQYDIEVKSTRKIRGAFFCETSIGYALFKEVQFSDRRAPLVYTLCSQLSEAGYKNVDMLIPTREGEFLSTARDGSRYILKKWYPGRECDVKREQDVIAASENLAKLHGLMQWHDVCDVKEQKVLRPPEGRNLQEEYIRHNRELKKVRSFMRSQGTKGEFETLYLKSFDYMYGLAEAVSGKLQQSGYDTLYRESVEGRWLVHGEYNYHNVLMLGNEIATTNFEHFHMDVQTADLYYFFRKVMEKHRWKESLGKNIIRSYQKIKPMDSREMEYLALRLAYPEKYWKTANSYYHSNKAWISEKSVEKLNLAIRQTEEKLRFLENIFTFIL